MKINNPIKFGQKKLEFHKRGYMNGPYAYKILHIFRKMQIKPQGDITACLLEWLKWKRLTILYFGDDVR